MDIGDIVIFAGKRFRVRGFDPVGVEPRFVYLDDLQQGTTLSIAFEEWSTSRKQRILRLVDDASEDERRPE